MMMYKIVLSILSKLLLTSADICLPSYHPITDNAKTYNALHRKTFQLPGNEKTSYFRTMLIDRENNRLIAGARNYVLYLNETNLNIIETINWSSKSDTCIRTSQNSDHVCENYIQFLGIHKDKLLMCGTNSLSPKYKIVSLKNPTKVIENDKDTDICATSHPDYRIVGTVTNLGEVIAGTFTDVQNNKSEIVGSYIMEEPTVSRNDLTTKASSSYLEHPLFVQSIYVNDSVYIFYMEDAMEKNNIRIATVTRLCQTDNGGAQYIDPSMWMTFRKARLQCTVDNKEPIEFKNLVSVTYDEDKKLFYAAFTMSRYGKLSSAVCTYIKKDFDKVFNGNFLVKDEITNTWVESDNGGFLNGCTVNPANLTSSVQKTAYGKEPTNSMKVKIYLQVIRKKLMSEPIKTRSFMFQFMLPAVRFTQIISENINNGSITIFYLATDTGSVYIVYQSPITSTVCIIDEVQTNAKTIRKLLLNHEKRILYIGSDEHLISLNVDSCDRYLEKSECIGAHNPLCGWSKSRCVSTALFSNGSNIEQDLTRCPQRKKFWDAWSSWKPCKNEDSDRYCMCRERNCQACDKTLCIGKENIQITKCTENPVSDVNLWLKEGPIHGSWSYWGKWSSCGDGKCGNKTVTRTRNCTSPKPRNGGRYCSGDSFECKSCAKKPDPCALLWSGWSQWGECENNRPDIYLQTRNRSCSRLIGCVGDDYETRHCAPSGIIWGDWTNCSCVYMIQHRYPIFIAGCRKCDALYRPEYRTCKPEGCNFPTTTVTTTLTLKTNKITTDSNVIIVPTTADVFPEPKEKEIFKENQQGIQLNLRDLIIAACGILITCFLVCTVVIVLILKRKKARYDIPTELHQIKSPELYRNKSIGNGIDELSAEHDIPLMKSSTRV